MKYLPLGIALFLLAGCATAPSSQAPTRSVQMRHSAYLGKKIGLFIIGTGAPYSKQHYGNKTVYAWNSQRALPFTRRHRGEQWMKGICEVRIYTKSDDRIYAIYALENDSENWDIDACAEYLK